MDPTVVVLMTGGTIGQHPGAGNVATPGFDPSTLAVDLDLPPGVGLRFEQVLSKGSKDFRPPDWVAVATGVARAVQRGARGVVVLHGTDTMHYTAAALSFMLRGLSVPVILTGSMRAGGDPRSDSAANLADAVNVAALADLSEVCIVFSGDEARTHGVILRGNRARKVHSTAIDAFASVDVPPLGTVRGRAIEMAGHAGRRRPPGALTLEQGMDDDVVLVKLTPTVTPRVLARFLGTASGAVLEGTGTGHLHRDLHPVVADFGRPTVVTTQAERGGEALGLYSSDAETLALPGVIRGGTMTPETALVKLMWTLGQLRDPFTTMTADIAGELGSGLGG